jgi:hypothetical protein
MSKFYDTNKFKKLKKEWYKKLEKSGFDDIELNRDLSTPDLYLNLKRPSAAWAHKTINPYICKHYQNIQDFLNRGTFSCPLDRRILELYNEGQSIRQIIRSLAKEKTPLTHVTVFKRVKKLKLQAYLFQKLYPEGLDD